MVKASWLRFLPRGSIDVLSFLLAFICCSEVEVRILGLLEIVVVVVVVVVVVLDGGRDASEEPGAGIGENIRNPKIAHLSSYKLT